MLVFIEFQLVCRLADAGGQCRRYHENQTEFDVGFHKGLLVEREIEDACLQLLLVILAQMYWY